MRILALRVRNLTSLAGEISVDFEAPPLAQAGLFAITGPTGAGKSTLLDALCLALYDEMPRLQGEDVRTALRHGTAGGHAEVDFIGRDGGRYRARWEVWRARNRVGGTLQSQKMTLTDLATGAALGGGKRETLEAIRDKVGLGYHQFRRSVLLAQNDFDAFLRARPDDRAALLELMTGTAIYGEISKAAFARCKAEEAALRALDEELRRVNVLADDERAAVEADMAAAARHAGHLADEVEGLTREIAWYGAEAELATRLAEADVTAQTAEAAQVEAEPERVRMQRVRRALAAAPLVAQADRLDAELRKLTTDGTEAAQGLADQDAALAAAADRRDHARRAEEQADAALRAAQPALEQAAALDTRLSEGHGRLTRAQAVAAQTAQAMGEAEAALAAVTAKTARNAADIDRLVGWLARNADRKPLAEQVERWQEWIAAHGRAQAMDRAAADRIAQAGTRLAQLAARTQADEAALAALAPRLAELDAAIANADHRLERMDADALDRRRDGLGALADGLAGLDNMAQAMTSLDGHAADLAARRATATTRRAEAMAALAMFDTRLGEISAALPEAQRALALAEAAEGAHAAALRQRLIDGQPCPVCGSRQHAPDDLPGSLGALLSGQRRRVAQLEGDRDDLRQRHAEAVAQAKAAEEGLDYAARDGARLEKERTILAARWSEAAAAATALAAGLDITLPPLSDAATAGPAVADARAECERRRAETSEAIRALRAAEGERRTLARDRDALHRQRQDLTARLAQAAQNRAGLEADRRTADAARRQAADDQAAIAQRLAEPLAALPDWRPRLADADALAAHVGMLAAEWRRTMAERDRLGEAARTLANQGEAAAHTLDTARDAARRDHDAVRAEQAALDALRRERARVLDGRPAAQVRAELSEACRLCKAASQQAQEDWAARAQARSAAENRARMLEQARRETADALQKATTARDAHLHDAGLDVAQVREAMALGEAWMAEAEARQHALAQAAATARAVADERRRALAAHRAAGQPERAADDLRALLPQRSAERDDARRRHTELTLRLAEDDRNRDAAADTRARIAAQRHHFELWKGMADLIGSADGKKFRLFAQGLTLERLLGLANLHLAELTSRYVLRRAPGDALDLNVIDRDMADEVRAVANLSGGERFLVSLSLALGLASMTGSRTLSESLFIDEGFGALDAESLDVAIGALETLHASGRKVGVISHVQAMIDRIGVQVRITKLGGGRSTVEVRGM